MAFKHGIKPIVTDGLVFCIDAANKVSYPGSGTTAIDIAGNKSGTLSSTPMFENTNLGVFVNDATDMINFGNTPDLFVGSFSVSVWFNKISQTGVIFGRYVGSNAMGDFEIRTNSSATFKMQIHSGGGFSSADLYSTTANYSSGNWYNVVTTFNHNGSTYTRKIYVDGVLDSDDTPTTMEAWTGVSNSSNITTVGAISTNGSSPTQAFNGSLGPQLIYNKALTQAEVTQNYNALKNRFRT